MRVVAKYLPQFHRVRENDEWWGKGFTEWTAVKGAKALFEGHEQPHVPQNEYYYNLLDKDTMLWQAGLMEKYGIDGMCIYHYWFKDGRQILERPAENLLQWTDVAMPFCFCWANETWARSWSGIKGANQWTNLYEKGGNGAAASNGILLEQRYGREEQWKEHFEYLLPFFCDERYIRVGGKPLFVIHKTADISCLAEMLDCWRRLAVECGLGGIYVIGSRCSEMRKPSVDAVLCSQPHQSIAECSNEGISLRGGVHTWEYDDIWRGILKAETAEKTFFEGMTGYDDTPRRGKAGTVIDHASPEKFSYYLTELMAKNAACGNDITFINAWNEWGEGMYLEPDEKYAERYLEAVLYAKGHYRQFVTKYQQTDSILADGLRHEATDLKKIYERDRHYLDILDAWMCLREDGFSVTDWLLKSGYQRVAVYGYGILGRHLCRELRENGYTIEYVIDRLGKGLNIEYTVYLPEDDLPETEMVLVSATYYYDEIYQLLRKKGIRNIISLQTILEEK